MMPQMKGPEPITDLLDFPITERRRLAEPRALIVAPTRELAMQIAADAEGLSKHADLHVVSLVGGMDYDKQRQLLKKRPVDILVATPGRLLDFVNNKEVDLWNVEVLVLDEADRMLSMGFIPDVRSIIRATPRKGQDRQTLLYSATFSDDIMNLARQWTLDAVQIEIARSLYMNERSVSPLACFEDVQSRLTQVLAEICEIGRARAVPLAAE